VPNSRLSLNVEKLILLAVGEENPAANRRIG